MSEPFKLTRIPALKTVADFRAHCATLGLELPCEDAIETGAGSPLAQPVPDLTVNGKRIGNRVAIHPMEGCDGTTTGGLSEEMRRRWQRFGESGAKLICGAEAMAVRPDGRANPNQLIISEPNQAGLAELVGSLKKAHAERHGTTDDLVIGFRSRTPAATASRRTKNASSSACRSGIRSSTRNSASPATRRCSPMTRSSG